MAFVSAQEARQVLAHEAFHCFAVVLHVHLVNRAEVETNVVDGMHEKKGNEKLESHALALMSSEKKIE